MGLFSAISKLYFSKLLASIYCGSLFTFIILNLFRAPVFLTPILFICFFVATLVVFSGYQPIKPIGSKDYLVLGWLLVMFVFLMLPRIPYFFDWLPNYHVLVNSDDYGRMSELISMTLSDRYPLKAAANDNYLLGFYYCSLYLFASIKLLLPFLTIKEVLGIGHFILYASILFSIYELSTLILRDKTKVRVLFFLFTLFGGFDWLISTNRDLVWSHYEWWQQDIISGNNQLSSMYTSMYWVIHHYSAMYAVILAFSFLSFTRFKWNVWQNNFIIFSLILFSFYASPFVFIYVALFLLVLLPYWIKKINLPIVTLGLISLPSLYIFTGKLGGHLFTLNNITFGYDNKILDLIGTFSYYMIVVPIVEFAGIPVLLIFLWKELLKIEKLLFVLSWIFYISTYFIVFTGANNYCMRGMLVPTVVFYFLFVKHAVDLSWFNKIFRMKWLVFLLVVIFSVGTIKETAARTETSWAYWGFISKRILHVVPSHLQQNTYSIARDKNIKQIDFQNTNSVPRRSIYDYEKFIKNLELENMRPFEKELIRKPLKQ